MTLVSSGFHVSIFIRNVHHLKPSLSLEASHLQGSREGKSLSSSPCRAALQVCTWNLARGSSRERIHLSAHFISAEAFLPRVSLPTHQYLFFWWLNKIIYLYIYIHTQTHAHTCTYVCCLFSPVWLFVTYGLYPTRLLCPWDSPGKNIGVGCHALLLGIFLTQGLNPCLLWLLHTHIHHTHT